MTNKISRTHREELIQTYCEYVVEQTMDLGDLMQYAQEQIAMGMIDLSDEELLDVTMEHAQVLAAKPISSLIASKKLIMDPIRERIKAARKDEDNAFAELLGKPANLEALQAFAEKRDPDFSSLGE